MKKRTLQEWANFLNMNVYINADGSARATSDEPVFKGGSNRDFDSYYHIMTVYWYSNPKNTIEIDRSVIDYSEFKLVYLPTNGYIKEEYYIGWEDSLKEPMEC